MSGCSACLNGECHDCDWWGSPDDPSWKEDYPEAIYCESPEFDDWYWAFSSDNCSYTYDAAVYNHYCDSCWCGDLDDGSYSCENCWYCVEGEEDIYDKKDLDTAHCEYAYYDSWGYYYYGYYCYEDAADS
mmetsp:Transcript_11686/g.8144  ORF Transcript_11686/g.8144 Transcript_11686/m.8144 type:complete len:130 (+) Transcript_11686:405-794(+)